MSEIALIVAVVACTAVAGLGVAFARVRRLPADCLERLIALEEAKLSDRETIETLIERAEDAFERAERKRRSAAAAASRANATPEPDVRPQTREEQLQLIRERTGVWT